MSSSAVSRSSHMLCELLASEKIEAKRWLRAEMDRLVDPLVDSLFYRLETKLTNGTKMDQNQSGDGGDCGQMVDQSFVNQSATFNVQTSASFISSLSQSSSTASLVQPPPVSITNAKYRPVSIKKEIEEVATTTKPMDEGHFPQSLYGQSNYSLDHLDEVACDCVECVYGIDITNEDDDDRVEDDKGDEESSSPAKKPRLNTTQSKHTQPEVIGESLREPTAEAPVNNQDKQFITVHLRCPNSDCLDTFPEEQLNRHMWRKHSIGPNRCLLKDCVQSFDNNRHLGYHIKQAHQHITQWHCGKCPKHFTSYDLLYMHNSQYHQLGHFQCSFPSCTFTGVYKRKMHNHYEQHKQLLNCEHAGCRYRTSSAAHLRRHQRTHSGFRPYLCKWSGCDFAAARKDSAVEHIRRHFAHNSTLSPNEVATRLGDLKDYLEVVDELM